MSYYGPRYGDAYDDFDSDSEDEFGRSIDAIVPYGRGGLNQDGFSNAQLEQALALSRLHNHNNMQMAEIQNTNIVHGDRLLQTHRAAEQEANQDFLKRTADLIEQRKTNNLKFNQESIQRAEQLRSDLQSQREGHEKEREMIRRKFQIEEERMRMERDQKEKSKREESQMYFAARELSLAEEMKEAETQLAREKSFYKQKNTLLLEAQQKHEAKKLAAQIHNSNQFIPPSGDQITAEDRAALGPDLYEEVKIYQEEIKKQVKAVMKRQKGEKKQKKRKSKKRMESSSDSDSDSSSSSESSSSWSENERSKRKKAKSKARGKAKAKAKREAKEKKKRQHDSTTSNTSSSSASSDDERSIKKRKESKGSEYKSKTRKRISQLVEVKLEQLRLIEATNDGIDEFAPNARKVRYSDVNDERSETPIVLPPP